MPTRIPFVGLSFGLVLLLTTIATACPLCGRPQKTFSEDFASVDVVVLAQWSDGESPAGMLVGNTMFSVVEVPRGESTSLTKDAKLSVPKFHAGQRGDLFLLFGRDGLMSSYLLLTGDKGLKVLDETKLTNPQAPFSEVYAAMQAVRFMWTYGNGRISPDRLRQSMRTLVDSPDLADLAIADLARWEDWSLQDRLMQQFGNAELRVKRAIVRCFLVAAKTKLNAPDIPASAKHAGTNLEKLRQQEPKLVNEAERLLTQ